MRLVSWGMAAVREKAAEAKTRNREEDSISTTRTGESEFSVSSGKLYDIKDFFLQDLKRRCKVVGAIILFLQLNETGSGF